MKTKMLAGLLLSALISVMSGCGGGGSAGSAGSGDTTPGASGITVSGVASKGPVAGGTVKVFPIISSATTNPRTNIPRIGAALAQGTTEADGSYSVTMPASYKKGGLVIQITGGSYTDESTGVSRRVVDQYGATGMRAIFGNISGVVRRGGKVSASVTPYTEMAVQLAGAHPTDHIADDSNARVGAAFGLRDIVRVQPLDANHSFPLSGSDDAKKYALALGTISEYQKDFGGGATMAQLGALLSAKVAGGSLDDVTVTQMGASANNYADSSRNPNASLEDPATNPSAPAAIHIQPATATGSSIGTPVSVSAQVLKADGTAVPDGTLVNLSTSFGTLSAASAATVNGAVSVTVNSATPGSAKVLAKSGAASAQTALISFVDPNAPAGMTLSASASPGLTTGAPVVLSANVTRLAGGAVPDGTAVSFQISAGSGTLSGATTTSGGVATVKLASSVADASVTVTAQCGAATKSITVPFIAQPTKAIVKLTTTGTLSAGTLIGGINATLNYSTGKGLSIIPAGVTSSGVAASSTLIPNTNGAGHVVLGLIDVNGIAVGQFVTLSFNIAAGNFPTAADFSVAAGATVIDTLSRSLGNGIGIASVTIQ